MAIQALLSEWFSKRNPSSVEFRANVAPPHDPDSDDYVICYSAAFKPHALNQARVEVWETTQGGVAIGLETTSRIARRLSVNCRKDHFAAGHEPTQVSTTGLLAILESIANGEIMIAARAFPWFGVAATSAVAPREVIRALMERGYNATNWISVPTRIPFPGWNVLRFNPW
jgi:hypothetical protein